MGELTRRGLLAAAVGAGGLAMLPGVALAQDAGQGYRLLIEEGVDAISVRTLIAGRLGQPGSIGRIARKPGPDQIAAIARTLDGTRTIVVARPEVVAVLQAASRGRGAVRRRIAAELERVLPARGLELLEFA